VSQLRRFLLLPAALLLTAASDAPLLLREQAWTAPSATLARDLTQAPGECLAARSVEIEIGRALFRSPALLGGPAARAGLSCNACHADGRANVRFLLPELTDRPGAADVTSEWSSRVRGDGVMNPVDIPDLAGVAARAAFGQAREPSLETFVRGVIEEEFQGEAPPTQAFDGVIAYLRALDATACPEGAAPVTLANRRRRRAPRARRGRGRRRRHGAPVLLAAQDASAASSNGCRRSASPANGGASRRWRASWARCAAWTTRTQR
jgi:hypothetical protein